MDWHEFQWDRISAFFIGIVATVLYVWMNPFQYLPAVVAAALASVPVGLCIYGVTSLSWRTTIVIATGAGIGIGFGTYLDSIGFSLPLSYLAV